MAPADRALYERASRALYSPGMLLRLLLTSDLHLGMKFGGYPDAQSRLAEERFRCLERIVTLANDRACDLLVVAGDLFERVAVSRRDVERAAAVLARFAGRVCAVLPGNHDFVAPDDELWRRFREASGDRTLVLSEPRPTPLGHYDLESVCLYPGPCTAKHSRANAVGWVRGASPGDLAPVSVGVAHGSLEGYSPDFAQDYYPMTVVELRDAGPRLWLVGHTHAPFTLRPAPDRFVACAGTPEPDGFDCSHQGSVHIVSVDGDGHPEVEEIRTGHFRFVDETAELRGAAELRALENRFSADEGTRTLLRLTLTGVLAREEYASLEQTRRSLGERLLHLDWRAEGVREQIDAQSIDSEFTAGSFPHRLLSALSACGDAEALATAYELVQEARR